MSPQVRYQVRADTEQLDQESPPDLPDPEMEPVTDSVELQMPAAALWEEFRKPRSWPRWNRCFFWVWNQSLKPGDRLIWIFQPIRWWYLYKMPAMARIVEVEPERKVTWEVTVLPGFHAFHTYFIEEIDEKHCRFGSWERASGWSFRLFQKFWLAHFRFVLRESLQGARTLEAEYIERQESGEEKDRTGFSWKRGLIAVGLILVVGFAAISGWLYLTYLHPERLELAPGVTVVLNGGSNTLVIKGEDQALIVDPKFPPASTWLKEWTVENLQVPVRTLINTHYHYDHTFGNAEFPDARTVSHYRVPDFMQDSHSEWWEERSFALPDELVGSTDFQVNLGANRVTAKSAGPAHTRGDLIVHIDREDAQIVMTGDLFNNGFYPFIDLSDKGSDLDGLIRALRRMVDEYPNATFVPGHGRPGTSSDVRHFAAYLEHLYDTVKESAEQGLSESDTLSELDAGQWNFQILPSFHQGRLCLATASSNIRWTYQLLTETVPPDHCRF